MTGDGMNHIDVIERKNELVYSKDPPQLAGLFFDHFICCSINGSLIF